MQQLIASICLRSRGEIILECMTVALEAIAATHPGWLSAHMQPGWYQRYHRRANDGPAPLEGPEHEKWLIAVGQDGKHLLRAVHDSGRRGMADLPEIQALRREWQLQFTGEQGSLALIVPCTQSCRL